MEFEYDERKSKANRAKHGIDFVRAQELWLDQSRIEVPARSVEDEPRSFLFGMIDGKHWSAVFTKRGDSIRIISVRRSRDEEVRIYEG
ncbi:MAG TPA: BrnT family toxin [Thermoanaerobaculia bacterium]|nr:BrnT family toxin [Thermoanaerobaculia bacterium]